MSTNKKPTQVARPAGRYFKGKPGAAAAAASSGSESDSDAAPDVEARKAQHLQRQGREMGISLGSAVGVDSQGRIVGVKKEGAACLRLAEVLLGCQSPGRHLRPSCYSSMGTV